MGLVATHMAPQVTSPFTIQFARWKISLAETRNHIARKCIALYFLGTGKTESVKALGGLFGRQVLVFNCDEGIDVKSMGRIFIGLIKCGAW